MPRAAIYARISEDRSGEAEGVARQLTDCRALAQLRGLDVVGEFTDNDMSAWSGKPRPGWEAVLELAREGNLDAVVAWHPDRLYRVVDELVTIRKLFKKQRVVIHTVQTGDLDFANANDKLFAVISAAFGEFESDHKADRIARAHLEKAIKGEWKGGQRPWGFDETGVKAYEPEARAIREAAELVLAGRTMKEAADHFNRRTANTKYRRARPEKVMTNRVLRDILISHRIVGKRVHVTQEKRREWAEERRAHRGAVPLQPPWIETEFVYKAKWDVILDEETWNRLRRKLLSPEQLQRRGRRPQKSVLGGLLKCGECMKQAGSDGKPIMASLGLGGKSYTCVRCKSVAISARGVERLLIAAASKELAKLRDPYVPEDGRGVETPDRHAVLERRKVMVRKWYREGTLSEQEAEEDLADIERQLRDLGESEEGERVKAEADDNRAKVLELWNEADVRLKGDLLRVILDYVVVDRLEQVDESGKRIREGRRFYPGRCSAKWAWDAEPHALGDPPEVQRRRYEESRKKGEARPTKRAEPPKDPIKAEQARQREYAKKHGRGA